MTRRGFLLPAAAFLARPVASQLAFPGVAYRDYHSILPDYLGGLAARACQARRRELDKLTSAESIRLRQKWVRETLWRLIGGETRTDAAQRPSHRYSFTRGLPDREAGL